VRSISSRKSNTSNLTTRIISAVFIVLTIIFGVLFNAYILLALFGIINIFCLIEYQQMVMKVPEYRAVRPSSEIFFLCLMGTLSYGLITGVAMGFFKIHMLFLLFILLLLFFVKTVIEHTKGRNGLLYLATSMLGVIWVSIPLALFVPLAMVMGDFQPWIVMGVIILVWLSDTGAYFFGKSFGKTKLYESISPSKTREGSLGALFTVEVTALILYATIPSELSLTNWLIIGVLVWFFGTIGDLAESILKRSVGVKDSGTLLPGHGGFLDRFDAMVLCIPFVYAYIYGVVHVL